MRAGRTVCDREDLVEVGLGARADDRADDRLEVVASIERALRRTGAGRVERGLVARGRGRGMGRERVGLHRDDVRVALARVERDCGGGSSSNISTARLLREERDGKGKHAHC